MSYSRNYSGFKEEEEEVNFDYIGYDYKAINQKILYELLMVGGKGGEGSGGGGSSGNRQVATTLTKTLSQPQSLHTPTTPPPTSSNLDPLNPTTSPSPTRLTITFNYDI